MRKLLTLAAAVATSLTMSTANAAILFVDNFNQPTLPIIHSSQDPTPDGAAYDLLYHDVLTGQQATSRDVYQNTLYVDGISPTLVSVGQAASGRLDIQNNGTTNSLVKVVWAIDPIIPALANGSDIGFFVKSSNPGVGSTLVNLSLTFTGAGVGNSFTLPGATPNLGNFNYGFGISALDAAKLSTGGSLELVISGTDGWDFTIDQVQITIPEPTSLALVGLALVGAGFAASRRKA
jgi:hypothetical protein